MVKERKYHEWAEHPRWKELCDICRDMEGLKKKSMELRGLIQKEVYGDNSQS